jgi:hypothetical protein
VRTGLDTNPSYMKEWIKRFRDGAALSKMDLRRLRDYGEVILDCQHILKTEKD